MSKKINLDILKRAEREGVRLVVDGPAWTHRDGTLPIDTAISPARCDVVAEARRVANMIATRTAEQPEDVVYANSTVALEVALKAMLAYIEKHMPKGKSDAKHTDGVERDAQQTDADVVDHADARHEDGGEGGPAAHRHRKKKN